MALGPNLFIVYSGFCDQKYTAQDRFRENGPYAKKQTEHEPISTLGFTSSLPSQVIIWLIV